MCLTILVWTTGFSGLWVKHARVGLCPEGSVAIAIPMHVSSKNVFFDRFGGTGSE